MCISATVYPDTPFASITGISYKSECVLSPITGLVKSSGTKEMFKACMSFLVKIFSKKRPIKGFVFKDQSTISCSNGWNIALDSYYFAKHGKTWYQSWFNAKPFDEDNETFDNTKMEMLEKAKDILDNRNMMPFTRFYRRYILENSVIRVKYKDKLKGILETLYSSSDSYKQFVEKVDNVYDCSVLYSWLDVFVKRNISVLHPEQQWVIFSSDMTDYPVTISKCSKKPILFPPVQRGAGKPSKKDQFYPYGDLSVIESPPS
jgi:hypothetical protein